MQAIPLSHAVVIMTLTLVALVTLGEAKNQKARFTGFGCAFFSLYISLVALAMGRVAYLVWSLLAFAIYMTVKTSVMRREARRKAVRSV